MKKESYAIEGGSFVLPDRVQEGGRLVVLDGRIDRIEAPATSASGGGEGGAFAELRRIDASGAVISPGFMEMHIHGAGGIGFDAVKGGGDILAIRDFLLARGISAFVPTLLCDEVALGRLVDAMDESGLPKSVLPGIYIEGPFVNPKRRGGIPANLIRPVDTDYLRRILSITRGKLAIMTLAPELPGIESVYDILEEAGVMISLGHSDCNPALCPLPGGVFSITHLFNAMSGISHREAGLANLAFSDSRPFVELNADSIHVNRECMRLVAAGIDPDRLILTSDAVVAAGLPFGKYRYFGYGVVSGERGVRYGETDTLMGSNRLGSQILRSWQRATGAPLAESLRAMTVTPARLLGMEKLRGGLAPGMPADIMVWDSGFSSPRRPEAL
jgi:N-acetylglucosamine-6-phosphate deacetylase